MRKQDGMFPPEARTPIVIGPKKRNLLKHKTIASNSNYGSAQGP